MNKINPLSKWKDWTPEWRFTTKGRPSSTLHSTRDLLHPRYQYEVEFKRDRTVACSLKRLLKPKGEVTKKGIRKTLIIPSIPRFLLKGLKFSLKSYYNWYQLWSLVSLLVCPMTFSFFEFTTSYSFRPDTPFIQTILR